MHTLSPYRSSWKSCECVRKNQYNRYIHNLYVKLSSDIIRCHGVVFYFCSSTREGFPQLVLLPLRMASTVRFCSTVAKEGEG